MAYLVNNGVGATFSTAANWDTVANVPTLHASSIVTPTTSAITALEFTAPNTTNQSTGVIVYCASNTLSAGTITASLEQNSAGWVSVANSGAISVTSANMLPYGFFYFRWTTPFTYTATTANYYRIKLTPASFSGTLQLSANSAGSAFAYLATDDRHTAPTSTNDIYVMGANNGTATITVDGTANVVGTGASGLHACTNLFQVAVQAGESRAITNAIYIGKGGTLDWDNSASSTLTVKGNIAIGPGGTWEMDGSADQTKLLTLMFDMSGAVPYNASAVTSSGGWGITKHRAGTAILQGAPKTSTSLWKTTIASGVGTAADPVIMTDAVDWIVGDKILIPSSSDRATNRNESENRYIITKNSSTSYVWSTSPGGTESGITAAYHTKTTYALNITRNVHITSKNNHGLRMTGVFTNNQTVTISGIVFTSVTTIGTTAGNFLIGADVDVSGTNLANLINNPSVTDANQRALSAGNQALVASLGLVAEWNSTTNTLYITSSYEAELTFAETQTNGDSWSTMGEYLWFHDIVTTTCDFDWVRFSRLGSAQTPGSGGATTTGKDGLMLGINSDAVLDARYVVCDNVFFRALNMSGPSNPGYDTVGWIVCNSWFNYGAAGLNLFGGKSQTHTDFWFVNIFCGGAYSVAQSTTFTRCFMIGVNRQDQFNRGGFVGFGEINCTYQECEAHCNARAGFTSWGTVLNKFIDCQGGTKGLNSPYQVISNGSGTATGFAYYHDFLMDRFLSPDALPTSTFGFAPYMLAGSEVKFNDYNGVLGDNWWFTKFGYARTTTTNARTASSKCLEITPNDSTYGFTYDFLILARANTAVQALGFVKKHSVATGSVATVSLFLPGSTTADFTQTMPTDANWNPFVVYADYTGSTDLFARVEINIKATSGLFLVDDIFNGTNNITALDASFEAKPSPVMFEQLGDAAAVWAVPTAILTTAGTTGKKLVDDLETGDFIALK